LLESWRTTILARVFCFGLRVVFATSAQKALQFISRDHQASTI
jgi:hypothetical protein